MEKGILNEKIIACLGSEFQSLWLINVKDNTMSTYMVNEQETIPGSVEAVGKLSTYEQARVWYINNCVVDQDKQRMFEHTDMKYICPRITGGKSFFVEYSRINSGNVNYNQLVYSGIFSDDGELEIIILGFRDIDVRKSAERDDLTGLYTRPVFFQKAEQLLRDMPDTQFDLMISDIVDFKEINETYGAKVGDEVLKWAGNFLAPAISDDILVGRYGGDQFVVMTTHDKMQMMHQKDSVIDFMSAEKDNGLPNTVVKFGIYENVRHDKSIISTCDKAHMALNTIKHSYGKMTATYNDMMKEELETHRKIESSMHAALAEEQFKVYYQPKHDATTGKLIGAEALIRWIHPEYGFMSPGDFIPLFEKNGFVVEIDYFVWKKTCENLRKWQDMGIKTVPISVNASKLTFDQPNLLRDWQTVVDSYNISPDLLHIEITETLMADDVDALVRKLAAIRTVGYQIELDDFGSGYSSINILSSLPLDIVKLDMSFMKQFGDAKKSKVLAACIKLAKDLGYRTVSEGVEMEEQRDMLSILGVDAIQGYYFSKPLPQDDFEEYLRNA